MLVLMQQVDDAGVAPMNTTEERLANLRRRLDTDAKGLVLLRSRDLVRGSSVLLKLESSVRNMALDYYKAQSKRVKRYKKALAKTPGYQALHARLSFKIAHYYEFRRYTTKVLQHYEASYRAIIALPLNENEAVDCIAYTQVMTMAEFVNFKLCYHLIFSSNNIKGRWTSCSATWASTRERLLWRTERTNTGSGSRASTMSSRNCWPRPLPFAAPFRARGWTRTCIKSRIYITPSLPSTPCSGGRRLLSSV